METQITENWIDTTYTLLLNEQTRLMNEMRTKQDQFKDLEHQLNLVISVMKTLLKLKAFKQKLRMRME